MKNRLKLKLYKIVESRILLYSKLVTQTMKKFNLLNLFMNFERQETNKQ